MTPPLPQLCRVGAQQAPLLAALHAGCFPDDLWDQDAIAQILAIPGSLAVLARRGDQACGFALLRVMADESEILSLGVLPPWRRRGLARRLVKALCEIAADLGAQNLHLEVAADNSAAHRLYGSLGFQEAGRRRRYYQRRDGPAVDALLLKRAL